ncbi:hypothetical protein SCLCIDRAFT_1207060 [Scleroderma citrinum Foug A]|uniref:Uncharacterized protein n=1 Tax=Scleroderma citrinum Foug A TaxID=1036808 RepID=A0A0C3ESQ6_9AGAM|nr:hypothetical protein SCLCIDRAFT_1207060 [Scleroderma citrinum Foug A]
MNAVNTHQHRPSYPAPWHIHHCSGTQLEGACCHGMSPEEVDHILYLGRASGRDKRTTEHRKGNSTELSDTDSARWLSLSGFNKSVFLLRFICPLHRGAFEVTLGKISSHIYLEGVDFIVLTLRLQCQNGPKYDYI